MTYIFRAGGFPGNGVFVGLEGQPMKVLNFRVLGRAGEGTVAVLNLSHSEMDCSVGQL